MDKDPSVVSHWDSNSSSHWGPKGKPSWESKWEPVPRTDTSLWRRISTMRCVPSISDSVVPQPQLRGPVVLSSDIIAWRRRCNWAADCSVQAVGTAMLVSTGGTRSVASCKFCEVAPRPFRSVSLQM